MNEYERIVEEIGKNENELRHLNSEREALKAAEKYLSSEYYQKELSTIERFLARVQEKLEQNKNQINSYNTAYNLIQRLDRLNEQFNDVRDDKDRKERDEEIAANRDQLARTMRELNSTLAEELRNRVIAERTQTIEKEKTVEEPKEIEELDTLDLNPSISESEPKVEEDKAYEITENDLTLDELDDDVKESPNDYDEAVRQLDEQIAQNEAQMAGYQQEIAQVTPEGRRVDTTAIVDDAPDYVPKRLAPEENERRNVNPVLTPEEILRIYGPVAEMYDEAGITETRVQKLVEETRNILESQNSVTITNDIRSEESENSPVKSESINSSGESQPITETPAENSLEKALDLPPHVEKNVPAVAPTESWKVSDDLHVNPGLNPEEILRIYDPFAKIYDEAGITETRTQKLVEEAQADYNETIQEFTKIFDDERQEKSSSQELSEMFENKPTESKSTEPSRKI